jgi:ATP-dependent Clp protease protease subunit
VKESKAARAERTASYQLDVALAKAGMPRSERRSLLQNFKTGTPSAARQENGKPRATVDDTPCAVELMSAIKSIYIEI